MFYVCMCANVCMCSTGAPRPGEGRESLEAGMKGDFEQSADRTWEPKVGAVQAPQKVLLTPEPFLQLRILTAPSNPQPSFIFLLK